MESEKDYLSLSEGDEKEADEKCKDSLSAKVKQASDEKKTRRRAQIAKSARRHRIRQKAELISLRTRVQELQEALTAVTNSHTASQIRPPFGFQQEPSQIPQPYLENSIWQERPLNHSLRGLWLNSPICTDTGPGLNCFHEYHHLGADPVERLGMVQSISAESVSKMYNKVMEETSSIPSFPPYAEVRATTVGDDVTIKFCRVCEVTSFDYKTCFEEFSKFIWSFDHNGIVSKPGLLHRKVYFLKFCCIYSDSIANYQHNSRSWIV